VKRSIVGRLSAVEGCGPHPPSTGGRFVSSSFHDQLILFRRHALAAPIYSGFLIQDHIKVSSALHWFDGDAREGVGVGYHYDWVAKSRL